MRPSSSPHGRGLPILGSSPVRSLSSFALGSTTSRLPSSSPPPASPSVSPEQLLDRLSKRLDLLKAGRGVDPRQQTLRATIEWSYDLLDEEERLLVERLSVFRGGCMLEAAEEICDADIDTLQSLIDKSLLRRAGGALLDARDDQRVRGGAARARWRGGRAAPSGTPSTSSR